jgi:hypothetical protein
MFRVFPDKQHRPYLRRFLWLLVACTALMAKDTAQSRGPAVLQPYSAPPTDCTEAHAWGLRNIPRASRFYAAWLDQDSDGIACEP